MSSKSCGEEFTSQLFQIFQSTNMGCLSVNTGIFHVFIETYCMYLVLSFCEHISIYVCEHSFHGCFKNVFNSSMCYLKTHCLSLRIGTLKIICMSTSRFCLGYLESFAGEAQFIIQYFFWSVDYFFKIDNYLSLALKLQILCPLIW